MIPTLVKEPSTTGKIHMTKWRYRIYYKCSNLLHYTCTCFRENCRTTTNIVMKKNYTSTWYAWKQTYSIFLFTWFYYWIPRFVFQIWIFGDCGEGVNTKILYPGADPSESTLIPFIQQYVVLGVTINSDGWTAYCDLNSFGYRHFTILHKYSLKRVYKNISTGEGEVVYTNQIEGSWKHAKDYCRRMSGTKVNQFEGHLAVIMWRSKK